jgi:hypothetical protein
VIKMSRGTIDVDSGWHGLAQTMRGIDVKSVSITLRFHDYETQESCSGLRTLCN